MKLPDERVSHKRARELEEGTSPLLVYAAILGIILLAGLLL